MTSPTLRAVHVVLRILPMARALRSLRRMLFVVVMFALWLAAGASAVYADPPPVDTETVLIGGVQTAEPLTETEIVRSNEKSVIARQYHGRKMAGASQAELRALTDRLFALTGDTRRIPPGRLAQPDRGRASASMLMDTNYSAQLYVDVPTQSSSTYCGPASAYGIISYTLGYGNAYNGNALTQSNLGSSAWLQTDSNGTGFDSSWPWTLNGWGDGTSSGWYIVTWSPSVGTYISSLVTDVDLSYPLVLDVHMVNGGSHLVGYASNVEYWHYVVAEGYTNYGNDTYYHDPFDNGAGSRGRHTFSSSTMTALVNDRGIIW